MEEEDGVMVSGWKQLQCHR